MHLYKEGRGGVGEDGVVRALLEDAAGGDEGPGSGQPTQQSGTFGEQSGTLDEHSGIIQ
jgi:hypothetical protein